MYFNHDAPARRSAQQHIRVLLVMDVVESVRLMEEDERDAVQRWQQLVGHVVQQVLPSTEGRLVKSLGDGLMLEFRDARHCIQAAFAILAESHAMNARRAPERQMHLRMGAHIAGFVTDEHDIYGADVNLAVRLTTLTQPGELVVSAELRAQLVPQLDAEIEDLGECFLKHISKPVRAYRVSPPQGRPALVPSNMSRGELRPTLAIIPFTLRSAESGQEMIGEALADELIAALSKTVELEVISRLSTTAFRERPNALEDIREHLGASYVLAGSCRSMGTRLAVFVELIDTRSKHVLWAESLKADITDLFGADDSLIERLVASISASVLTHQLRRARSQALPTLDNYTLLLGAIAMMHSNVQRDFDRARGMLEHLIERTQRQPLPYAYLAHWWVLRSSQGWSSNPQHDAQAALDCTKRSLDNDPENALALTIDGLVHTNLFQDPESAHSRYEAAIQSNPNESLAWLLKGTMHAFKGEGQTAVHDTELALRLSPLDPLKYYYDSLAATAAMSAGHYEDAILLAQRSLRRNRTHTSTYRAMAISQALSGDVEAARKTIAQLLRYEPDFTVSQFIRRSPSSKYAAGPQYAQALRLAGVPE